MAPNHISSNRLIYRYPLREEPAQKEQRSDSILRHKFQKHPLTPQFYAVVLRPKFAHEIIIFLNNEAQHAKNTFENRFSIPLLKK